MAAARAEAQPGSSRQDFKSTAILESGPPFSNEGQTVLGANLPCELRNSGDHLGMA